MLQEQADWYQAKTDPFETVMSFCIVNSEHCQTSKIEIFAKIITGILIKNFILHFLQGFEYASALEIVIFIIKPNPIFANNNPKL